MLLMAYLKTTARPESILSLQNHTRYRQELLKPWHCNAFEAVVICNAERCAESLSGQRKSPPTDIYVEHLVVFMRRLQPPTGVEIS